ncbi:MAG: exo-beta-N-acetylmuramidase NamZ family protein [Pyrinomonadaceae bacterium]
MTNTNVVLGIERLITEKELSGVRLGLVCNQASVDHQLRHSADMLNNALGLKLTTLFGPQHGIRGDIQDNMIETPHSTDPVTGLPVYSLYSETREPTEAMLESVDAIVFDMQDVGCRVYTFIYTLANCMIAAKKFGRRVIVCDRPNPIGGQMVSGNILEPEHASFVGMFPIPMRHGMTVGELAKLFNECFSIGCELEIIPMKGWRRELWFDELSIPWIMPSPNMPTLDTATVFAGSVFLEGTKLSEGRGTTRPFELIGAPYINPYAFAFQLKELNLKGVKFRPAYFQPTFQKHARITCGGVQIHVCDRSIFDPVIMGLGLIKTAFDMYGSEFSWKEPPYEYVYDRNPFDVICGTQIIRKSIESGDSLELIEKNWAQDLEKFKELRSGYLIY